jgi:lysophospholipase L1-like esterase
MTLRESMWKRRFITWLSLATTLAVAAPGLAENTAVTPVPRSGKRWLARQEAMNRRVKQGGVDLIFIGDSIVENWEHQGRAVWEQFYAQRRAVNLGISGDCTEHVLWRLQRGNLDGIAPKLAIVMIGQNNGGANTAQEIAAGVKAIIHTLRARLPQTKILLLAIFYRGEKPNAEQRKLAEANAITAKLADDKMIFYKNINRIFLRPDGTIPKSLMPDFEHPSAEGHRIWAEAIEPTVARLMGETAAAARP